MADCGVNIKSLSGYLQQASSLFLFANLPFYFNEVQRWAIIIFVALSVIDIIINQRWRNVDFTSKPSIICYTLILQFLLLFIFLPVEQTTNHFAQIVESRLSYVVFGVLGLFFIKRETNFKAYAYTALAVSLGIIVYVLCAIGVENLIISDDWRMLLNISRHNMIQAHMAVNIYFSATLLLILYLMKGTKSVWLRWLYIVPFAIIYAAMTSSDGRVGMVAASVILLTGLFHLFKRHRRIIASVAVALIAGALLIIWAHPKTQDTFNKHTNPRIWIWKVATEKIVERPIIGYGANTAAEQMREGMLGNEDFMEVNDMGLIENLRNSDEILGSHPHNQILLNWLEYGFLGLTVILTLFILTFKPLLKGRMVVLPVCFWCIIILQLMTETIHTSMGEVAFCLYLCLLLQIPENNSRVDDSLAKADGKRAETATPVE